MKKEDDGPDTNGTATRKNTHHHSEKFCTQYKRWDQQRRNAEHRSAPLACGCRDPWLCRCQAGDSAPSDIAVDAYRDAVNHLAVCGLGAAPRLDEMRMLWRRGGTDRKLVSGIASRWEVSA